MSTANKDVVNVGLDFLAHYGVKGMRWGQRKQRAAPAPIEPKVESIVKRSKLSKTKIKGEGGHNHPATEDALKAAAAQQKLKKSGPAALSNKELQDLAQRLNLEQQVTRLDAQGPAVGVGRSAARKLVRDPHRTVESTTRAVETGRQLLREVRG